MCRRLDLHLAFVLLRLRVLVALSILRTELKKKTQHILDHKIAQYNTQITVLAMEFLLRKVLLM